MPVSAGLLLHRVREARIEVFLVHPGGPFWKHKDAGSWGVPKGLLSPGEDPLAGARREFLEETGFDPSAFGTPQDLGSFPLRSGKQLRVFAVAGDCDPAALRSNLCTIEWPPRSGRPVQIPEVDRGAWFGPEEARGKILTAQRPVLERFYAGRC
ncbi:MAG: NUDIX domain-containing protein [Gammaproteobacteria bacterium]|nr:NUDIX domain-containing protein [Gammaproteobacteria bacterium]MBV9620728.1 NUDIX domain-containing protein [Gammaproteobacteria bacterium]